MIVTPFGTTAAGDEARLFTLRSGTGFTARVSDYGATLVELHVPDRGGEFADVVLGFDSVDGYASARNPYFGATIGRVANRIAHGTFVIAGDTYNLARNESPHHLHGGVSRSFDKVSWQVLEAGERHLKLRYLSAAGEEGYPGEVAATAEYRLTDDALVVEYQATTDVVTPVNMTNHAYFNLAGAGSGTILDHELQVRADTYTEVDDELIPTGEVRPVDDTPLDFRSLRRIGERLGQLSVVPGALGYDHNFVLRDGVDASSPAAVLRDPVSGRILELSTDQPCLQFYSGNRLDPPVDGKAGQQYGLHGALCLEPQRAPDAVNHPGFGAILLEPGSEYRHTSHYRFATGIEDVMPHDD